jgi:hypothetical protein
LYNDLECSHNISMKLHSTFIRSKCLDIGDSDVALFKLTASLHFNSLSNICSGNATENLLILTNFLLNNELSNSSKGSCHGLGLGTLLELGPVFSVLLSLDLFKDGVSCEGCKALGGKVVAEVAYGDSLELTLLAQGWDIAGEDDLYLFGDGPLSHYADSGGARGRAR